MVWVEVSVILVILLGSSCAFQVAENVIFEQTREISVVRSKWIFSFFVDLKSYRKHMERIHSNLVITQMNLGQVIIERRKQNSTHYLPMFQKQMTEIKSLKGFLQAAQQDLKDILILQRSRTQRVKRAVLPIVGKALSWLFGTVSKAELRRIKQHMRILADNQEQIVHVLDDTVSILNSTNIEVRKNRHAIRSMVEEISQLEQSLADQSLALRSYMSDMQDFLLTYLQFNLMITEIREAVERAMFYMENVKMQLDQLTLGHVAPTVIQPEELMQILAEIKAQIPEYLTLPAPIGNIWYYYKTLTCVTLVRDHKFITLVTLPLLELNSKFEVYNIHNIPLPYPNNPRSKLTAKYELETDMLAVNAERTQYMQLKAQDLAGCYSLGTDSTFCTVRNPVFDFGQRQLCVTALFRRDKKLITEICKTAVKLDSTLPQGVYLPNGNWIIVSTEPFLFTIICLDSQTYQVKTEPPLFRLQLAADCEAHSDKMMLPPFYYRESNYGRIEQKNTLLSLHNSTIYTLWRPMDNYSDLDMTTLSKLPDLAEIKEIPLDSLVDKLEKLKGTGLTPSQGLWKQVWEYFEKIFIVLMLLGLVLLALWLKVCKGKIKIMQLVRALGSRKIKAAGTVKHDTVTDPVDAESVPELGAESTEGQPVAVEVQEVTESGPRKMAPLVLDLASEAPKSV